MDIDEKAQSIWSVTDLLRGEFKESEYGSVTLPFTVLRRLGYTSRLDLDAIRADPEHATDAVVDYLKLLPDGVRDVMDGLRFEQGIERLRQRGILDRVLRAFAAIDLHPDRVSDAEMGDIFDALTQRAEEQSNQIGGEHSTPPDVNLLLARLLVAGDLDSLRAPGVARTVFDPACGKGGALSAAERLIAELSPDSTPEVFGQDINSDSVATFKARRLIRGWHTDQIRLGNSLTEDRHGHLKADYVISSPPFGLNWNQFESAVRHEHETLGLDGRFGPGLPRRSDSTLLFLLHMLSKMKAANQGGARLVLLTAGAPLWAGDAGSGGSNIRRHLIESDLLEGVVALPSGLLPNTTIPTYVWVVTNRKRESRRGCVRIIDGSNFFEPASRQRGRRQLGAGQVDELLRLFAAETDSPLSRVYRNDDFGFVQVSIADSVAEGEAGAAALTPTVVDLPLSSQPEVYLTTEVLPHRPTAKIQRTTVGYAVQRIVHLGFELARALATVEQQYRTYRLRPLHQMCVAIQDHPARDLERSANPADALSIVPGLRGVKLVPDETLVSADYLAMFFSTDLGKKLLSALASGTRSPDVSATDLAKLPIPLPTLAEQRAVLDAKGRIDELAVILRRVEEELAANPGNIAEVNQRVASVIG